MELDADVAALRGVLHVTAVWRPGGTGAACTLRILDDTPQSREDARRLAVSRACADAILTTGRILREEPELRHDFDLGCGGGDDGDSEWADELRRFRRSARGQIEPPRSVVLTTGVQLDTSHPLFRARLSPLVVTGSESAAALAARLGEDNVVTRDRPDVRDTVELLMHDLGLATVSVEAGPSTAAALYAAPCLVDELWLSTFLEPELPAHLHGGAFLSEAEIDALFGAPRERLDIDQASGRWRFERYHRK